VRIRVLPLTIVIGAGVVTGCTWVAATPGSAVVHAADAASVMRCRFLGTVTTSVLAKVAFIPRCASKVKHELLVLAKNEAATMGGDTVVAAGPPSDGRQEFAVYRCAP
jgi:Domain of unknown function (DUF4156)